MLRKFTHKILSFLLLVTILFSIIVPSIYADEAFEYISTNQIMQEIEKTLLFNNAAAQASPYKTRKDSLTLDKSAESSNKNIEITVIELSNKNKINLVQKQKLAYSASISGQLEVAIALYKQILAVSPKDQYTKFALASTYQRLGQFKQAKALYYELLKPNPVNRDEIISNLLSIIVEESPRDAIYLLTRLATQTPNSDYIMAQTAMAYSNVKNYDQAIYFLNRAIALNPAKNEYKFNLAVLYDKIADYNKALNIYQDVLSNYNEQEDATIPALQIQKRIIAIKNKF
jgi:tetratricopeptide (TPR) repeat protein